MKKTETKTANTNSCPRHTIPASPAVVIDLPARQDGKSTLCATTKILPSTHVLLTCGLSA
ncbi:hypothetical protein AAFO92_06395 [Roseovarius sp. CAU 1744]|uniref:hypothetical protein n=1 Tax=Roseovarius sp. CAU 1744 TaxID=3140368 RepID=UPI00325A91E4